MLRYQKWCLLNLLVMAIFIASIPLLQWLETAEKISHPLMALLGLLIFLCWSIVSMLLASLQFKAEEEEGVYEPLYPTYRPFYLIKFIV